MASELEITHGEQREAIESAKELARFKTRATSARTLSGVIVRFTTDGEDGRAGIKSTAVERGLAAIAAKGIALPLQINVLRSSAEGVRCVAFMSTTNTPDIYLGPKICQLNPVQPHVSTPIVGGLGQKTIGVRGVASQIYDLTGRKLVGDPKLKAQATAIFVHEMGHVLHSITNPQRFWDGKAGAPHLDADWDRVAQGVSHYATQSALEFVAEVFCGTIMGRAYSGAIQTAYAALGGPTSGRFWN